MAKKAMKLVNASTGLLECKTCGSVHFADIKPMSGGHFYRGAWECRNDTCPTKFAVTSK
jgi:hypothetical protein